MQMQKQQKTNWCWAAVAVSIHNFLNSGGGLTQGEIATQVLQAELQIPKGVDCTQTPNLCNFTAALDDALRISGDLQSPGGFQRNRHLDFQSVKAWVDAKLPVGARIVWFGGGAHFVAVDGYREFRSGARQVHVQDPFYGPTYQSYEDFVADYPPGGNWQDTYLVR
jgi:hypothetical protein